MFSAGVGFAQVLIKHVTGCSRNVMEGARVTCKAGQEFASIGLLSSLTQMTSAWPLVVPSFSSSAMWEFDLFCLPNPGFILIEFSYVHFLLEPTHWTTSSLLVFSFKIDTRVP